MQCNGAKIEHSFDINVNVISLIEIFKKSKIIKIKIKLDVVPEVVAGGQSPGSGR